MMKIVYAGNDEYFDGLYLSILSILRRSKETFKFYLLTADFTNFKPYFNKLNKLHETQIIKLVKNYNKKNNFFVIDCIEEYNKLLKGNVNEKTRYSPYTTLRLLIDQYDCFKTGKVLYLDIDTMANADIKAFDEIDLVNNEFAVAHDALGRYWQHKDCFNAGVILFNMDICIKNNLFVKAREIMFKKKMYFPDQSALNSARTKFMFFPGNDSRFNNQTRKLKQDTIIKHFCSHIVGWPFYNNIKQWDFKNVHKHLHMHVFDEEFKLLNKIKEDK